MSDTNFESETNVNNSMTQKDKYGNCTDENSKQPEYVLTEDENCLSNIDPNCKADTDNSGSICKHFENENNVQRGLIEGKIVRDCTHCEPLMSDFEFVDDIELKTKILEVTCEDDSIKQLPMHKEKLKRILNSLISNDLGYQKVAAIAPAGLLNDEIRQKVWPALVGVDIFETSPRPSQEEIENHPYYTQVVLDVNRSISRFPPSINEKRRLSMQDQLVFLIMRVLVQHPEFHYYQGYHDICVTFLLVLGEETAYHVVERLSVSHLNVFMEKTMESTIRLISYMYPVIGKERPELLNFLVKSEVGVAFCLSWLITWFGHVLNDYDNVVRLFDFFIVSHPWMPMYLSAAIVLHQGTEVMKLECEMACVHSFLAKISDELPYEELILKARLLLKSYPQEVLERDYVYLPLQYNYEKRKNRFLESVIKNIKNSVPTSKLTYSLVIAAAVLLTAVLYQAYK